MAWSLDQSTSFLWAVSSESKVLSKQSGNTKRDVKMMCTLQAPQMRVRSFFGSQGVNSLDNTVNKSHDFHSTATSVWRGKDSRIVHNDNFEHFTKNANKVITSAQEEARRAGHNYVGTEHILLGLIGVTTGETAKVFKSMGINLKDARVVVKRLIGPGSGFISVEIPFTPRAKHVFELSLEEARQLGYNYIGSEHLLLGLLRVGEGVVFDVLENLGADPYNIRTQVIKMISENAEVLEKYCTDLTKLAEEGKLSPVFGKNPEIERVAQLLASKNNPCLMGERGVGKTAIVKGLAQRIANGDVPETIKRKKVIALDMHLLDHGEFEGKLKMLMEEIEQNDEIILFIEDIHIIGAGVAKGAIDAANILKRALAREELQCIGETTLDQYRKHIEKYPSLERLVEPIKVHEPTVHETIQILKGLREQFENHHKLRYTDEALVAAVQLSHECISDRFLPDKAIGLIDGVGFHVRLRHHAQVHTRKLCDRKVDIKTQHRNKDNKAAEEGPIVTAADIQHFISSWPLYI